MSPTAGWILFAITMLGAQDQAREIRALHQATLTFACGRGQS